MLTCRLLGPVEVWFDDERLDLGFPRQRTLLAILLVEANRLVTVEVLIDRIWGDHPPARASHALYADVSKLRRALAPACGLRVVRRTGGYAIEADPTTVDLHCFRTLRTRAHSTSGDEDSAAVLDQALALWDGEPFAGLDNPWLTTQRASLNSEKLAALLDRNDAYLGLGWHAQLLTELTGLIATRPLDERLAAQHMLALHRSGRTTDALSQYQHIRGRLADELGVDPNPALRQLHQDILRNAPRLRVTMSPSSSASSQMPRQLPGQAPHFVGREADPRQPSALLDTAQDARRARVTTREHTVDELRQAEIDDFCARLRRLRAEAGSPTLDWLSGHPLCPRKSQLSKILRGQIRRLPDADTVTGLVARCAQWAQQHDRRPLLPLDDRHWLIERDLIERRIDSLLVGRGTNARPLTRDELTSGPQPMPGQRRLRQLPVPPSQFTGRARELSALNDLVDKLGTRPPNSVVISAIDGMPGIGKTALALHLAHRVADRFPDRQLHADLYGHTPGRPPADPADVLAALLTEDGVDARYLPGSLEGRAALWRERTAGRRVLLVLDNAASSRQVEPLLPGTATCLVLITSRRFLGDLPAGTSEFRLDVLSTADAIEMFVGLAPRAADARAEVAELVAVCGYLPLAIALLARLFTRHPAWTMADLIDRTRARLLTLTTENRTIAAAFELSYRTLEADQRQFFRYLGLHPGIDFDPYAAAALAGVPLEVAAGHLEALHAHRLIEEHAAGRFRMHDLIREYARTLIDMDDQPLRDEAVDQLLEYYQLAAQAAGSHVDRLPHPAVSRSHTAPSSPDLSDWDAARTWMTTERANLVAGIEDAARRADVARQVGLTAAIAGHLRVDGPWSQGLSLHTAAADAARGSGDVLGQAGALLQLGDLRRLSGDYPGATDAVTQARTIYATTGNHLGEANALLCLGEVLRATGDFPGAAKVLEEAQRGYAGAEGLLGQANALLVLGTLRQVTCDYPAAVDALTRSMTAASRAGNRLGAAEALRNLGAIHHLTGDLTGARQVYGEALEAAAALGDRLGEANVMAVLGMVWQDTGDPATGVMMLERALAKHRDIGSQFGAANALSWLGDAARAAGDLPRASSVLYEALAAFDKIGNRHGRARAFHYLGRVHVETGDTSAAEETLTRACDTYREVGDVLGETQTLNEIGTLHVECGEPSVARPLYERALALGSSIGNKAEADRAEEGIRRCRTVITVDHA